MIYGVDEVERARMPEARGRSFVQTSEFYLLECKVRILSSIEPLCTKGKTIRRQLSCERLGQ